MLFLMILATSPGVLPSPASIVRNPSTPSFLPTLSSGLGGALHWLDSNQSSSGSYGDYREHWAAAAAYALWLNNSNAANAALSYSYLAKQMSDPSSWFWGAYGEADVPGLVLYSIASSSNLGLVNPRSVAAELLQFQKSTGGFAGYYDLDRGQTVTSSVDTDMALLGLLSSNLCCRHGGHHQLVPVQLIPAQNRTRAIQYLLTLQNTDGSFNLTSTRSYDPIYSLGPDPVSITALTLLALKSYGFTIDQAPISNGLRFLSEAVLASSCENGHVYSTAVSTLVFNAFDQPYESAASTVYILSQENRDGGFSDSSRSSYPRSDALDTGWAAIALEPQSTGEARIPSPTNCLPVAVFSFSPQPSTVGVSVQFNASKSYDLDTDQLSFIWTFGDGSSGEGVNPNHTYTEAGNFTITLTVIDSGTNPGPLSGTKSGTITIQPSTVQKSPGLPISTEALWIILGAIGLVAVIAVAFDVGRRSTRRPPAHTA